MQFNSSQPVLHGRRVALSDSVARELRMLAIEGFTALRRRGLEVGGILLGHATDDELCVERFQEVPCEHRYGPSYVLSDADREKLTELLEQARSGGEWRVIGAFRSFTGRDPVIEPADEALVAEHFPLGDFVLLFLHPISAENCVISFHLFRDGQLLRAEEQPVFVLPPKPIPEPEQMPFVVTKANLADGPPPESARRRPAIWKAALIGMAVVLGGSFAYELGRAHKPPAPAAAEWAELNLDARSAGSKLEVTWDTRVVRSVHATRGTLTISEGRSLHEIELGPAQLGAGRYTYAAERPDVTVRLTLLAGDRTVASESARLTPAQAIAPPPAAVGVPAPAVAPADLRPEVPPSAVHEVQPRVPEGIRSRVREAIVIGVEVQVSEHGRVVHAKARQPGVDGLHRYLAGLAERAAREWRFTPARRHDGTPVAAAKTIQFVFTPTR